MGIGDVGDAGDTEGTAPGAGGVGPTAVALCEPGSTIVSESWILGFVLGSTALKSARNLYQLSQRILTISAVMSYAKLPVARLGKPLRV